MKFIGKTIAGYKIKRQIGMGGMGTVYVAEAALLADSPPVAIKVLHRKLSHDKDIRERFKREAKLQYKLDHPNIVKLNQYLEEGEDCFIIMEYFPSKSLSEIIGKKVGPMPHKRAIPIFQQVLAGIKSAHDKGIIHRDIKPSNILLDDNEQVKITDFGVAKEEGVESLTRTGMVIGSVPYMSPAQVKGNSKHVNIYSDIYSLGITFYEMLAGRTPFEGGDFDVMSAHINITPKPPTVHYPHIPEYLVDAVLKSLSKKQSDRYKSCDEFSEALEKPKIIAPPKHVWSNFEKSGLTAFVGLLVIALATWINSTDNNETEIVPGHSITLDQPNGSEVWEIGQTKTVKWSSNNIPSYEKVFIDLYKFGGFLQRVAYSTSNDGKYDWKIGDEIHESENYKIKIYHSKTNVSDFTDKTFTIKQPSKRKNYEPIQQVPVISAEEFYNKGIDAYKKENYDEAIEYFDFAINKKANYYNARYYRGWSHFTLGNTTDADKDADYNAEVRGNAEDYYLKGRIKIETQKYNSAIDALNSAIKKKNNDELYYYYRGYAKYMSKEYSDCQKDFTECISIDPKNNDCFIFRALARYIKKEWGKALSDISNAIKINGNYNYSFYIRGLIYLELNNIVKACSDFKTANRLGDPDSQKLVKLYCN